MPRRDRDTQGERERGGGGERQTDRQTDRQTETERDRERDRDRWTDTQDRDRNKERVISVQLLAKIYLKAKREGEEREGEGWEGGWGGGVWVDLAAVNARWYTNTQDAQSHALRHC